jgi:hypothetical protein
MLSEYTTNSELKKDGRVIIGMDTRNAGDMKQGDILQLKITVIKKAGKQ